ncbi:MAG: hypothetical protein KJ947_24695 [Alphaproteobacteria bacterium]|nr:hypothetical protein [Alphaproteobacteria bacterium]MBU1552752.1 hypothetical protein [Alphaproteobacteria bacterium]MBU2387276.1 hypothetical protein [Alphaproteobacteria bacterium]
MRVPLQVITLRALSSCLDIIRKPGRSSQVQHRLTQSIFNSHQANVLIRYDPIISRRARQTSAASGDRSQRRLSRGRRSLSHRFPSIIHSSRIGRSLFVDAQPSRDLHRVEVSRVIGNENQCHHIHAEGGLYVLAWSPVVSKVTLSVSFLFALNGFALSASKPDMVSACCDLSVGAKVAVSPATTSTRWA